MPIHLPLPAFRRWRPGALILVGLMGAGFAAPPAMGEREAALIGRWDTGQGGGVVEIEPCGKTLCARIRDAKQLRINRDQRDVRNPDPALRTRKVMGLSVMDNIRIENGAWRAGPVYDPLTGRGAPDAILTLADGGVLTIKACIARIFCRVRTWRRLA